MQAGIRLEKNKAEPITIEEEESVWHKGLLGDTSPDILRDTIVYNSLYVWVIFCIMWWNRATWIEGATDYTTEW